MKALWILLIGAWMHSIAVGQGMEETMEKADGSYRYHYFEGSKKVSTLQFRDNTLGNGYTVAYNAAGQEIYRQKTSRQHLISGVTLTYHPNGAVHVAHYRWHPDGGIQSGGTRTMFDPRGNKIAEEEDQDPNELLPPTRIVRPKPADEPESPLPDSVEKRVKQPTNPKSPTLPSLPAHPSTAQPEFRSHLMVVNRLSKPVRVHFDTGAAQGIGTGSFTILPGDTVPVAMLAQTEKFAACDAVRIQLSARKAAWIKSAQVACEKATVLPIHPMERKVIVPIE